MTVRNIKKHLADNGYVPKRNSGAHEIWGHSSGKGPDVPIPRHKGDLPPGTTRSILKTANITEK